VVRKAQEAEKKGSSNTTRMKRFRAGRGARPLHWDEGKIKVQQGESQVEERGKKRSATEQK